MQNTSSAECVVPLMRDEPGVTWQLMANSPGGSWLHDKDHLDNLPAPDVITREIVEDLTAALTEFGAMATVLEAAVPAKDPQLHA